MFLDKLKGHRTWIIGAFVAVVITIRMALLDDPHFIQALPSFPLVVVGIGALIGIKSATYGLREYLNK